MSFSSWWHHITDPHCADCAAERQEKMICLSCETLKEQLARVNSEKEKLLDLIVERNKPQVEQFQAVTEAITPKFVPWRVKQQQLEAEDRIRATTLMQQKLNELKNNSVEQLEKEMEISDAKV